MTLDEPLVTVRLLQLPLTVWSRAQEQHDALIREFALMSAPAEADERVRHVPSRLVELIAQLSADFDGVTTTQDEELATAAHRGLPTLDLTYLVPAAVAPASRQLGALLDEADAYCRQGRHLLTLAPDEELVRFRWWFLEQFIDQIAGQPPVAWPAYRRG